MIFIDDFNVLIISYTFLDRNPSPPPEILDSDENLVPDRIGDSVYSKRWLYKTLMNMLKVSIILYIYTIESKLRLLFKNWLRIYYFLK